MRNDRLLDEMALEIYVDNARNTTNLYIPSGKRWQNTELQFHVNLSVRVGKNDSNICLKVSKHK